MFDNLAELDRSYVARSEVASVLNVLYAWRDDARDGIRLAGPSVAHLIPLLRARENVLQEVISALAPLGVEDRETLGYQAGGR
jgi:hypothetical protein